MTLFDTGVNDGKILSEHHDQLLMVYHRVFSKKAIIAYQTVSERLKEAGDAEREGLQASGEIYQALKNEIIKQ